MSAGKPILVTGSHRSGSTWVGKMLAFAPQVVYFHEPFNADYYAPGRCGARFCYRFTYIAPENEGPYVAPLRKTAAFHYNWRGALAAAQSWKDLRRAWNEAAQFRAARRAGRRALFKDPLALLSAGWLADRLSMDVIVLIRHPAAFVSSVKRFNWRSPLSELLAQPLLMRDYLQPYVDEIRTYAREDASVVEQAAVFWKMLYTVVVRYRAVRKAWAFVRHEDLSRRPQAEFERLFAFVRLPFTPAIAEQIAAFSSDLNPADIGAQTGVARIDSRANVWRWKARLSAAEVETVYRLTQPVAAQFYTDADWGES